MAHEVEQMAYAGAVPWHGLGTELSADTSIEEWIVQAGLDWEVSKHPVLFNTDPTNFGNSTTHTFKNKFVLARNTDNRPYAVVSSRYKPVQPKQILEHFRDLVANYGMTIETAGSLRDGQRVWAMARTNDAHKVMGVDEIKGYLMLATSYDLTFSTLAYLTSVRVVCNNTLQASFGDMVGRISVPHFKEFNSEDVKQQMGMGREQWDAFAKMTDVLAGIKLDVVKANEIAQKVFKVDNELVSKDNELAKKHAAQVIELFQGTAKGADIAGQTGWGLVNATSEYVDQHKRARNSSNRLDSAWFGEGFGIKQRVVDETLLHAA
jgi:phage/plasmid-like protein (TIGR03299 family)